MITVKNKFCNNDIVVARLNGEVYISSGDWVAPMPVEKWQKELEDYWDEKAIKEFADAVASVKEETNVKLLCKIDYRYMKYIKNANTALYKYVVSMNGLAILYVPKKKITKEIIKSAIKNNGDVLGILELEYRTPEVSIMAVKQNGISLKYCPVKTPQLCAIAVIVDPSSIRYVPDELRTEDMIKVAIMQSPLSIAYIDEVSEDIQMLAVIGNAYAIRYIENPSIKVIKEAIKKDGTLLRYIPKDRQTQDIQMLAVQNNGMALEYIECQTPDIQKKAVEQNPEASRYINAPLTKAQIKEMDYKDFKRVYTELFKS